MASTRLKRLSKMAANYPVIDQQAENREQAALTMQTNQAIGAAPASANVKAQARQIGQAATAAKGQAAVQSQQQAASNQLAVGQAGVAEAQQQASNELASRGVQQQEAMQGRSIDANQRMQSADLAARKQITQNEIDQQRRLQDIGIDQDNRLLAIGLQQREDLHNIGSDLEDKLFSSTMRFKRGEAGRKFSNDRQLMDYAVSSAHSNIQLQDRMREMKQASDMKIIILEVAHKKLVQAANQKFTADNQKLDNASKLKLRKMANKIQEDIEKAKAEAANQSAMITGVFTVGGAVIGSMVGPAGTYGGAMAGATIGAGLGQVTSGLFG